MKTQSLEEIRYEAPPKGFKLERDGVYRKVKKAEGQTTWIWLCSEIRVLALPRDRSGNGWGRLVEFTDLDGNVHRWAFPARLLGGFGRELLTGLLDRGLDVAPEPAAKDAIVALLSAWKPVSRAITTDRLGWSDESCSAFVLGDGRVIGQNNVVHQHEETASNATEMKSAGKLLDWRRHVAEPCIGNPLMIVGVSLAFAGPLLEPLGMDGGGLHLRGASSRGKSTIQRVAVSVWGSPRFLHSWRATDNGLEGVATACNSTLLGLDELGEVSGRDAGKAAYMLANGTGKSRARRSGHARAALRWRVNVLSSGEITLADKIAEVGDRAVAGQAVRLLDIEACERHHGAFDRLHGSSNGAEFADRMRDATAQHYGTAGPALVENLIKDMDHSRAQIRKAMTAFQEMAAKLFDLANEGQVQRGLKRFALIAAAGELATAAGLTGWPDGAADKAALEVFGLWLDGRGGSGPDEARDALERVRAFLVAHGESRFEPIDKSVNDRLVANRAGWRDEDTFFISTDVWKEIHRGADPKRAALHLYDSGFLKKPGEKGRYTVRLPGKVKGRPHAYAVSAEIMGCGDG